MNYSRLSILSLSLLGLSAAPTFATSLMLDLGANGISSGWDTSSPGHDTAAIPAGETSWNTITTSADRSDLVYSDGSSASGVTLNLGQESSAGSTVLNYTTSISNLGLTGSNSTLLSPNITAGSIYGETGGISGPGRDGFFGGGSAATGSAIGMRIDGLAAGDYTILVMGRNTNTSAAGRSMDLYSSVGTLSETFDFSGLTADGISNPVSQATLSAFIDTANYASMDVTLGAGESLFLAVDGSSAAESRAFINMVQIVGAPVPEPGSALLGALGLGLCALRRRR